MRYGVDIDGVLRDFPRAFAKAMHLAPEPLSYTQLAELRKPDQYEYSPLVGAHNWSWFWQKAAPDLRVFENAYPIDGELENLAQLPGEVFLITSQPKHLRDQTYAWLARHHAWPEGVLHVSRPEEKVEFINALHVDVFVDDRLETLMGLVGETEAQLFVYDQPWNRSVAAELHPDITRIKSLKELL